MTEHAARLHELLSHAARTPDLAATVCRMISDAPEAEQADLFCRWTLGYKHGDSDAHFSAEPCFSEADRDQYNRVCKELLHEWIGELQAEQPDEEAFHAALWQKIRSLTSEPLRIMMTAVCAESPLLPWLSPPRLAPGAQFTADSFRKAVHSLDPMLLQMSQYILNRDVPHVAQDAAALLPLLERCSHRQEQTVLLTVMFLAMHEKIQLSEFRKMLCEAADAATEQMIREAIEEWDG